MSQPAATAADLARRLVPMTNSLAREIVERHRAEIPGFDRLPGDLGDVEVAGTARHAIRLFLRRAQGQRVTNSDLDLFRERAAQRAEEGVPLVILLRTYHVGTEVILDALTSVARPGEEAALLDLVRMQVTALASAVVAATDAYVAAMADQDDAVRELAEALLSGRSPDQIARRHGMVLSDGYLVVAVRAREAQQPVAVRRLFRQVIGRLSALSDGPLLGRPSDEGGHILLPAGTTVAGISARLSSGLPVPPIVGVAQADTPQDVPAAADQARRIARLADQPGVYALNDVLLEYHLAQPADSGAALSALLDRLDGHTTVVDTVRAFLECDLDRRGTALVLGVHPNTVDNRLARAASVTGIDPRTTLGVQMYGAAFTLRRLASRRA